MSAEGVDDASAPRVRQIAPVAVALLTAGLSAGAPSSARAQAAGDPLRDALVAHRLAVEVEEAGRLGGPGGRRLVSEGAAAQFFLIGEEHGIAEVPELAAWLFERLVPHGYRHLAVEIGPAIADTMAALARSSDPEDALIDFFRAHPPGAPFFNSAEEARLLIRAVDAVGMSERDGVLWGLDYDILGDRYALRRLRDLARTTRARESAESAIELADSLFQLAVRTGNPVGSLMFSGPESVLTDLRHAFAPDPGPEAERILHTLTETVSINGHFLRREVWESNDRRARLNKLRLVERYRAVRRGGGAAPRVLFRFGASHMMRGLTLTNVYDLGALAAALAEAEGGRSFHLAVVGGPDTERLQFDPRSFGWVPVPVDFARSAWMAPVVEALGDGPTLFDLAALRPLADRELLGDLDPQLERMIYGFDALLVLVGSRPGSPLPGAPWLR